MIILSYAPPQQQHVYCSTTMDTPCGTIKSHDLTYKDFYLSNRGLASVGLYSEKKVV
jgi:hypothetical protein